MATLNNFTITSPQNQDILIYSNGSWINSNISGFFGILDGRYSANTHNHDGRYILKADAYTKSQTYPAASLYTRAEIDAMFDGFDPGSGGGGGSGLVNSASNVGSGAGVFHANASGDLQFRSLFSQDIDLLTIAVSGTSVIFTPKVPTWSKLVSANGQLTTSHVNFANQGVNTSSKPSFAGLTVDTGSWSSSGLKLTGAAPSIYFSQNDNSNAYVGLNTNSFYVLQDTNSDGNFESPYALQVNLDGSAFRYYGYNVYHEGNKPTASDVGLDLVQNRALNWSWGSGTPTHIWASPGNSQQSYVYSPNDIRDAMNIRWDDIESIPAKIADFSDGVLGNTYTFNSSTYFNSNQVFSRPGISGVVEQHVHTDNYLRFRFGGSSDVKGLSISNYDTVTAYITREGSIKAQEYKNKEDYPLPDQNYRATAAELNTHDTKLTSFNTISDGASIGLTTNWHHVIHLHHNDNNGYAGQIAMTFGNVPRLMFRGANSSGFGAWRTVWTDATDGPGSGLNADLLDGYHESTFARRPSDHTTNNTEYSLVWENNAGTLYTSTAHLKYNPALRRISAGAVYLSGVNNDMLTLDSTGHANLVIDRASTSYDNNICFKTGGSLKWRLWMGAADDHIAFRHEPSGTQPVAIYERIIGFQGKRAFRFDDSWLRINDAGEFDDGIYCASSILRTDGHLQVGSSGSAFNASTSQIDLKVTTRVHNKLHVRELVSQDGNFTTIGAGELGNSLRDHVTDTLGVDNEGVHIGGEHGVYLYSHSNNMTGGMDASYSIRVLASDGASYLNHLDVYKDQNNSSQLVARFRHPSHNANVAIVSKNNNAGSFRFEANMEGQDLRIQTANTSGDYYTSSVSVGTIARFFRDGDVSIAREVTAQDFIATSDIRVKENLERIDSSLDKIARLTGFTYDQVKLKQRKAGLIAQEVKEVLPEAVGEDKDGMLNVSPMAVLALLVNAVNDLAKEVKELKR